MGGTGPDAGPYACPTTTSPTEPSLSPKNVVFKLKWDAVFLPIHLYTVDGHKHLQPSPLNGDLPAGVLCFLPQDSTQATGSCWLQMLRVTPAHDNNSFSGGGGICFETGSRAADVGVRLLILRSPPAECWDSRCVPGPWLHGK